MFSWLCILITLFFSFYIRQMIETRRMSRISNRHVVVARLYKIFPRTRIRHFAISSTRLLRKVVLTFECVCSTTGTIFADTSRSCRAHRRFIFQRWTWRYRRDRMQFTVFPVICPAHAVRALPKRRHLEPLKYKGSRKMRRDDGRGADRMASCNSKLFQWNGIERPVDLLVAQHPTHRPSIARAERKRKREWEGEGRGKELRKAALLHRLLDWFSLCSKILTTSLSSVDCIFTASNKGSSL